MLQLLILSLALAQPSSSGLPVRSISTAGLVTTAEYQTTAAMTLYVDPTGSDSNACTASGTSAQHNLPHHQRCSPASAEMRPPAPESSR